MEEESFYKVGDKVWYMDEGKAKYGSVIGTSADPDAATWTYDVEDSQDNGISNFDEYELFPTPEALVRDIFEDFEIGEDIDLDIE